IRALGLLSGRLPPARVCEPALACGQWPNSASRRIMNCNLGRDDGRPKLTRDGRTIVMNIQISMRRTEGRKKVVTPADAAPWLLPPARIDNTAIKALVRAHRWRGINLRRLGYEPSGVDLKHTSRRLTGLGVASEIGESGPRALPRSLQF